MKVGRAVRAIKRVIGIFPIALLVISPVWSAHGEAMNPEQELLEIREQLVERLTPVEAELLERVNSLEVRLADDKWYQDSTLLVTLVVAVAGWVIALFQFWGNRQQRTWELLLESLKWFEGGTQQRSIGIALVESKWPHHKEFRGRWSSILVNQAIYLLTKDKEQGSRHERANLYRIMDLLKTAKESNCITDLEQALLGEALKDYDPFGERGLTELDKTRLHKWKQTFPFPATDQSST